MRYEGAVILESVGFTAAKQRGALVAKLSGIDVPREGDFLVAVANGPSTALLNSFIEAANSASPKLRTVGYAAPAQGYFLPQVRFSDHASFWERDYPAIMLNDTVMFRNPNYHKPTDVPETVNFCFLTDVARAVVAFVMQYK